MSGETKKHTDSHGNRHRSRTLALQTLYACEVGANPEWPVMLERIAEGSNLPATVVNYARELCTELYRAMEKVDALIRKRAANWDIKRMAVIDRNIIRLAVTELCYFQQVPAKVVIDEAVELAKAFGAEDSGKFVNGIIDSIHKNLNGVTPASGKEGSPHGTDTCPK
ncbi:MAG: transcription antitermination factor NusB [Chitinispirillaceae bacterium]|nr:transcription antitermination factor NusB [Chitinispirillaceae bacterium]